MASNIDMWHAAKFQPRLAELPEDQPNTWSRREEDILTERELRALERDGAIDRSQLRMLFLLGFTALFLSLVLAIMQFTLDFRLRSSPLRDQHTPAAATVSGRSAVGGGSI